MAAPGPVYELARCAHLAASALLALDTGRADVAAAAKLPLLRNVATVLVSDSTLELAQQSLDKRPTDYSVLLTHPAPAHLALLLLPRQPLGLRALHALSAPGAQPVHRRVPLQASAKVGDTLPVVVLLSLPDGHGVVGIAGVARLGAPPGAAGPHRHRQGDGGVAGEALVTPHALLALPDGGLVRGHPVPHGHGLAVQGSLLAGGRGAGVTHARPTGGGGTLDGRLI